MQTYLREVVREPSVQSQVEAYRDQVLLYHGYGIGRSSEVPICGKGRADNRCNNQAASESEVQVL